MNIVEEFRAKLEKELKTGLLSLIILLVISKINNPTYGYQIIKEIEKLSEGKLEFKEGTIYPLLRSLQSKKLLDSFWSNSPTGPQRKYYEITKEGQEALKFGLKDWEELNEGIENIMKNLEVEYGRG